MRYLSICFVFLLTYSAIAAESFTVLSICKTESEYRLNLAISNEITGLSIYPSHSAYFEIFASGAVTISLDNEWVELRPISVEPMRYEMLYFENVASCNTTEETNPVLEALRNTAINLQRWGD